MMEKATGLGCEKGQGNLNIMSTRIKLSLNTYASSQDLWPFAT